MGRAQLLALAALLTVSTVLVAGPAAATVPPQGNDGEPQASPAQIVIVVDESGSLSEEDLVREREAAGLIAQSEFSKESTIAVIGFGSDEGGVGPVDAVCPPIVVAGAAERQRLSDCVGQLRKRAQGRGDDTDHAAALEQALTYFTSSISGPKIIFLLTDGVLDVGNTGRYGTGKTLQQRNDAAQEQLGGFLGRAAGERIQVWPLGFGNADTAALDRFAKSGFQGECGANARQPSAMVVATSADVDRAIFEAYSAAACRGIGPIVPTPVSPGSTVEVPVDIPSIATDGAITVVKHDLRIGVVYVDPSNRPVPKSGTLDGAVFEVSGENGPVEALRIVDPQPGRWKVRISSPGDVAALDVTTAVTWQGAVQALLTPSQSALSAGQPVTISMSLRTRRGPVTDAAQLAGLTFSANLTGVGNLAIPIPMADDGSGTDPTAGDGTYTGQVTVPTDASGTVGVEGSVQGIGISGDEPRATLQITSGPPALLTAATLPNINNTVAPGSTISGQVTVTNNSGQQRRVRLLIQQAADSTVTVPESNAVHEVAASGNTVFPAVLAYADAVPEGPSSGILQIVDDADPTMVYGSFPFTVRVQIPPPWLLYGLIVAVVLAAVAAAVLFFLRRQGQDLGGARVQIRAGDIEQPLPAVQPGVRVLRFLATPNPAGPPDVQLVPDGRNEPCYRLSKSGSTLRLRPPAGAPVPLQYDVWKPLTDGLSIIVRAPIDDERSRREDDGPQQRIRTPSGPVDSDL